MEASEFKFLGYRVSKITFDIKDNLDKEIINHKIDVAQIFSEENKRYLELNLKIFITTESKKLDVFLEIVGGFEASPEMTEELFHNMASFNAPAILFPYARSIISNISVLANIAPIILPTINFAPIKK